MNQRIVNTEKIACLIKGHIDGLLTDEERLQLQQWVENDPANRIFWNRVLEDDTLRAGILDWLNLDTDGGQEWQRRLSSNVIGRISPAPNGILLSIRRLLPYAAACLLVIALGLAYYFVGNAPTTNSVQAVYDVAPGGNKASLTLPDGRTLALSELKEGIVINNELTYTDGTFIASTTSNSETNGFFTISTPVGGQYQVTLADGTKVWLNAASTLTYPTRFADSARVVELEGEGYFEVATVYRGNANAKNDTTKLPFLVKTKQQTISVVGTAFNVAAYADEPDTKTTLVEGEVILTSAGTQLRLLPNEQGILDGLRNIRKQRVDVSEFIAWKQDLFLFNETELRVAMNQLSRWYDISIFYEGEIPNTYFYGEISRSKRLSEVLYILRKGGVNFKIERTREGENKLTVLR